MRLGLNIDDDTAHFSQKFPANEAKVIILALEIGIQYHHLRKSQRQELQRIKGSQLT
jgi:hypothetical protein